MPVVFQVFEVLGLATVAMGVFGMLVARETENYWRSLGVSATGIVIVLVTHALRVS